MQLWICTSKRTRHESKDFEADVEEELRCYNSTVGVSLQQPDDQSLILCYGGSTEI